MGKSVVAQLCYFFRKHPDVDVLVKWDKDGTTNVVSLDLLSGEGGTSKGSRVSMLWKEGPWYGKIVAVEDLLSDSDSDDVPLAKLIPAKESGTYNCTNVFNCTICVVCVPVFKR